MVPIDTVYQRVLALANKEQRGYVTPLEFNLLANQAQMQIFEQYFYDLDQFKRVESDKTSLSDMEELIKNKLTPFTSIQNISSGVFPTNYRIGKIFVGLHEAIKVDQIDFTNLSNSKFHSSAIGVQDIAMYVDSPNPDEDVIIYGGAGRCEVIARPNKIEWGYDVIQEKALYHAGRSTNSDLHDSEETVLVYKILELSGIVINKVGLAQTAVNEELRQIQQKKA